jgi:uncharacterized phage-like protein YoqJ
MLAIFLFSLQISAQDRGSVKGSVVEFAGKGGGIPGVNIYLEGTTLGTQTDSLGRFQLRNIPFGRYKIVASMVGYTPFIDFLDVDKQAKNLAIRLAEDTKTLDEIRVVATRDKVWEKHMKTFERIFLGESYNKKLVKIRNREAVDFMQTDELLVATASSPLVIENQTLGYTITYELDRLEVSKRLTSFRGLARFELNQPVDKKQAEKWEENRKDAYLGSLSHFLKSMMEGRLEDAGFQAGRRGYFYDVSTNRHFPFAPFQYIKRIKDTELFLLDISNAIELVYSKKRVTRPVFMDAPYPYTILVPKGLVVFNAMGNLQDPFSLELRGEMGRVGMAELLPMDYELPAN